MPDPLRWHSQWEGREGGPFYYALPDSPTDSESWYDYWRGAQDGNTWLVSHIWDLIDDDLIYPPWDAVFRAKFSLIKIRTKWLRVPNWYMLFCRSSKLSSLNTQMMLPSAAANNKRKKRGKLSSLTRRTHVRDGWTVSAADPNKAASPQRGTHKRTYRIRSILHSEFVLHIIVSTAYNSTVIQVQMHRFYKK